MKQPLAAIASAIVFICIPAFAKAAPAADAAAVEATRQMLDAMRVRELTMQSMEQAEHVMPEQVREGVRQMIEADATMNAGQRTAALGKFETTLPAMTAQLHALFSDPTLIDDMLAEIVPLYASSFTVDELHQLAAFYRSPLGRKMMATMPSLMAQSMEINNRVMMPRIQKLMSQAVRDAVGN